MKKIVGITITTIIVIIGAFYLLNSRSNTTFNEVVLEMPEITSIEIIKSSAEKEVFIENENVITQLLKHFSEAELKEDEVGSINFDESYWLTLRTNGERKLGITVYDENYLMIFDYSTSNQTSYRIISGFDSSKIEQYFD
ncbi:DUF5301 domain-containing protein [Bacillus sp. PS06]|uniref:DUF5301 domain-containing protein n=1 Tax=Bacillus sp. PS06 TaxID=2764176 RepID=UPI00177E085E|nr:DUF5301 domain-containing protein [Bacillus sp. PS06]MBD8068804.1 DUF5301 domain-containing protein [Bacillus sp. PS06]